MANVKPGDLAVIVKGKANLGKIVRVLRRSYDGDLNPVSGARTRKPSDILCWWVESQGGPLTISKLSSRTGKPTGKTYTAPVRSCMDTSLRRLADLDEDKSVTVTKEIEHA